ncbi:hypothetical protein Pmani_036057 [Petrolisthes manimaculis]|uniref:Uncharacterized protein n=1 Tax=Petrolisthes manimaculis TaxID=1843537 RepID=A0AAE1TMS0_9EUCA|nr:hypothetical protein Pmani_036057 [Petrolisthes manimaculis]
MMARVGVMHNSAGALFLPAHQPTPHLHQALDKHALEQAAVAGLLGEYVARLSEVAGSLITCGPVLNWLELDNRGHRLIVTDDSDINTPAVAAAYVVKRYIAQASDEISFEAGLTVHVRGFVVVAAPAALSQTLRLDGWLSLKDMLGEGGRICSSSLVYYVVYPLA